MSVRAPMRAPFWAPPKLCAASRQDQHAVLAGDLVNGRIVGRQAVKVDRNHHAAA
jgi:hypothetical protein